MKKSKTKKVVKRLTAIEVMEDLMLSCVRMSGKSNDDDRWYTDKALEIAEMLAPYQSPRLIRG